MANSSNSTITHNDPRQIQHLSSNFTGNPDNATSISTDWTPDEQSVLEEGLSKYAHESNIIRYAKIAVQLQSKTVRDVALRCRWMTKKENSKRRKEEQNLIRKNRDRKEKINEYASNSSVLAVHAGFSSYEHRSTANGNPGNLYNAFGGELGKLLQLNAKTLEQISTNLKTHQVHENISLFFLARENLLKILESLNEVPENIKQMPPFPVKLDEELVKSILPHPIM